MACFCVLLYSFTPTPSERARTEATIAAQRMGFDPTIGLMHADKRYRPSLSSDLMEPVRPVADRIVLEMLSGPRVQPR
jgi:CRISPR-associated protein Cas1